VSLALRISPSYRRPVFGAVVRQVLLGCLSLLILDGGTTAQICGIAFVAFWGGAIVIICRRPMCPTTMDLELIRSGSLPLVILAYFLVHSVWHFRGFE
jgi:hypothetical protein